MFTVTYSNNSLALDVIAVITFNFIYFGTFDPFRFVFWVPLTLPNKFLYIFFDNLIFFEKYSYIGRKGPFYLYYLPILSNMLDKNVNVTFSTRSGECGSLPGQILSLEIPPRSESEMLNTAERGAYDLSGQKICWPIFQPEH